MRTIRYAFKQAFVQVFRNRTMSIASIFSITAMLLILGLFFILAVNVGLATESAKDKFDTIQIYLLDETTVEEANSMIKSLESIDGVADARYFTKAEAMEEFKVSWGDQAYLLDTLAENPLPNSIKVSMSDLEQAETVIQVARTFSGVEEVPNSQEFIDQVLKITDGIQKGALAIIIFLVIVSVVVVSNTVKLTVLAREREISIMKYVGATNWFIRGPFLVEGVLIGCLSSMTAVGLVMAVYTKIVNLVGQRALLLLSTSLVPVGFLTTHLFGVFLPLGICIGAIGSIISMRRFLKA